ncbi:MAG: formate dehydrogenase subunit alpha [Phycisphaerae bacterium]|nr:formate dehydrogenase subunit alpha [Phycisphaerae bacterium]
MAASKTVSLTIDGKQIEAPTGTTILEAARAGGIHIPHLCHDRRLEPVGACRMCIVEVQGARGFQTACTYKVQPDIVVRTNTEQIRQIRKDILEFMLAEHRVSCTTCDKNGECKLMNYAYEYGADEAKFGTYQAPPPAPNYTTGHKGIEYDPTKCIKCQRCVRICSEVVMANAITLKSRAYDVVVSTAFDLPLNDTTCENCGQCVSTCPTGALYDRSAKGMGMMKDLVKVRTTCPYCGVGCQMDLCVNPKTNRIARVTSKVGCVPNGGNLCVKGKFAYHYVGSDDRLKTPLIRKNGKLVETDWDTALKAVADGLGKVKAKYGPSALATISSCRCTNEENYLMQKFTRAALGTNNVDQCATTCHGPTVAGLALSFGSGAMTNSIEEIQNCDLLFVIGSNPTEAHPVIGFEMKKALRRGAKLIVADPRKTWMAQRADVHLQLRNGTDNMLINAMMHTIISEGLEDKQFVAERTEGYDALKAMVMQYPPEEVADKVGVDAEDIKKAARMYAPVKHAGIFYTLGITEHTCGTENVRNLANLSMLTGHMGYESTGVNPLRGQNNVQGGCDMGAMAHLFQGYQKLADPDVRLKFEKAWGVPVPTDKGGKISQFFIGANEGNIKGMYIMGEDVVMSEPNRDHIIKCIEKLDFLAVQEIFLSETAKLADVVLPAACWAEKDGTFTNSERRVQRVRKAVDPPGQVRPDWQILCDVSTACGYEMKYDSPKDVWDELADLAPIFSGIRYDRIDKVGIQWPCPDREHPGTKFLHKGKFTRGLGEFAAIEFRPPAEVPDDDYPLILSTGRTLYHYNVGNMTRKSPVSDGKQPENFVMIHVDDAAKVGVRNGQTIRVVTRRGRLDVKADVADVVKPGTIWMPFHFAESSTNVLTNDAFDNIAWTGEYKACAARLEKV